MVENNQKQNSSLMDLINQKLNARSRFILLLLVFDAIVCIMFVQSLQNGELIVENTRLVTQIIQVVEEKSKIEQTATVQVIKFSTAMATKNAQESGPSSLLPTASETPSQLATTESTPIPITKTPNLTATGTPTLTPTPTSTSTPTLTPTPTATDIPTFTPTFTVTPQPTPTPIPNTPTSEATPDRPEGPTPRPTYTKI